MEHPRIDLAHVSDFRVGSLNVHPSTRELSRDGERLVIEPRVMQVLVALHRAGGAVVSKDDLSNSCWDCRVVGEDAINRVISRLRKVSDGIGKGLFHVETVTRVGYRLMVNGEAPVQTNTSTADALKFDRRTLMMSAVATTGIAGFGAWFVTRPPALPPELADLLERAETASAQGTPDQISNAVALLQEAGRRFPNRAEPWGRLAIAYNNQAWLSPTALAETLLARSDGAAKRSLQIDPNNSDAALALIFKGDFFFRNWSSFDSRCRTAVARFPNHNVTQHFCGSFLFSTGRIRQSIKQTEPLVNGDDASAGELATHAIKLWSAGRVDEADTLIEKAKKIWPRQYAVWFSHFKLLNYSGRTGAAQAMLDDVASRPVGIPDWNFAICEAETRALRTKDPKDVDIVLDLYRTATRKGLAFSINAALFASATDRLDFAFEMLEYYFNGSNAPESHYSKEQSMFVNRGRATNFLFIPPNRNLRADPRFLVVTRNTGLEEFWRSSGVQPDYRS